MARSVFRQCECPEKSNSLHLGWLSNVFPLLRIDKPYSVFYTDFIRSCLPRTVIPGGTAGPCRSSSARRSPARSAAQWCRCTPPVILAQQVFRRTARRTQKKVSIVAAARFRFARISPYRVFHGHIHGYTALVHTGVQLPAHFVLGAVHAGQDAGITFSAGCSWQPRGVARRSAPRPHAAVPRPHHDLA